MLALIQTIVLALDIYWWIIIGAAIFSWLYAFNVVNPRNEFVGMIGNMLFQGMDLEKAVAAGRVHWEDNRFFFEGDIDEAIRARAKQTLDQPVTERRKQDLFFGGVHAVEILEDGTIVGVADPRRDGVAIPL